MYQKTYSADLRERAISYLSSGYSQRAVAELLTISKTTVGRWACDYQKSKSYLPKQRTVWPSKIDPKKLATLIKNKPDLTLEDMGEALNVTGAAVFKHMKKRGYSYKKKHLPTWRQVPNDDQNT